jgi:hypothetical protein
MANDWAQTRGSILIARPVDLVFGFVCDPRNDGKWLTNVGDVRCLTRGPIGAGSRFHSFPIFLGARIEVEWQVTAFEANSHIASRSVSSPIAFERTVDCETSGSGTKLSNFVRIRVPFGLPFMTRSAVDALLGNAADRALARLKSFLERGEAIARSGD